jgi:LPS export ABC transporter protein LptC
MYLNLRNALGFVALATAAGASWYWSSQESVLDQGAERSAQLPLGYYLRDAEISVIDADGRLLYEIFADAVEERPDEDRMVLDRVYILYTPAADVSWEVRASRGEIPTDRRHIDLIGAVELMSKPQTGSDGTIIRTPRLRLQPEEFLATTDVAVNVSFGEERLQAVGMSVYLKDDYLELESSVHGQFNP